MKVTIACNKEKKNFQKFISELRKSLKNHTIYYEEVDGRNFDVTNAKDSDFIIIIGGDGTILNVASKIALLNIPILGINTGHVGFLTQIDKTKNIEQVINKIINKNYKIDKRTLLQASIYRHKKLIYTGLALNEVLLARNSISQISRYTIYLDEKLFNNYSSDGFIVATPTGSTAYNLSAGGAIISPSAKVIALTPICVHAFNQRGIVIDDDQIIKIIIESNFNSVVLDGNDCISVEVGDEVIIKKAKKSIKFLKFNEDIFIKNLKLKMHPM